MATKTHERADLRDLRRKLDDIRAAMDSAGDPFVFAMEQFLTAADYRDDTLMRSALEEAKGVLEDSLTNYVLDLAEYSTTARAEVEELKARFEGLVVEPEQQFDDLGRSLSLLVREVSGLLREFVAGTLIVARKHGMSLPNAAKLDEHIAYWEGVKADLVDCWPWTDAPLPPADRAMIAASRAALQAGERGESLEAVIERRRSK